MSKINIIQNAIKELEGGSFQKLFDAYLYKKYKFENIHTLGVQEGTNKTTKGTPDSFVVGEDGKYILIMYGTVEADAFDKMKKDILSCFNKDKLEIDKSKIERIICAYSSTNIHVEQIEELKNMISGIQIELIGLSTISHDLLVNYPFLATEFLQIPIDTQQIYSREEFIKVYDKNGMNAPLKMDFCYRDDEKENLCTSVNKSKVTLVIGPSGVGKTRLVLEVCKQFEDEGWNVLCVKNNGGVLYNDMKYYTSDAGKYILFIDDANETTSLEYILEYVTGLSEKISIKLVMTVRDYAKSRVQAIIGKYVHPAVIMLGVMKSEEIKHILKTNLSIVNSDYLERITQIAKGNARLAILAGRISLESGYLAISNTTDIFANYYGRIINKSELTEKSINALFVISLLGAIRFKESVIAQKILELVGINTEYFIDLCHELNEKELIDLYQDEVAKVSDQSLGNYIIEYVLIEKKTILISQLLQIAFPAFKNKLVFALNTLMNLFYSENMKKYIEEQVNISWGLAEGKQQEDYLKCFHALNQEKTLEILKRRIDDMESVEMDLATFDIEGKKNNHNIHYDEIRILSSFKYSEYYQDALELMLMYFDKRPDLVMDFYFAFSDEMSFDEHSFSLNYEKEYNLIECIWRHSDNGKNSNATILMLYVLNELLECSFDKTKPGDDNRTFNMIHFQIVFSDESKKIRLLIWKILSSLYSNSIYVKMVSEMIAVCHVNRITSDEAKKFFEYDLQCIKELFFDKWGNLSFEQCKILRGLEKYAERLEVKQDSFFARYTINKDFMIYNTLTKEHLIGRTLEEEEIERKREIEEMIHAYKQCDYGHLFEICKICEENKDEEIWSLKTGLDIIFEALENRPQFYYDIVRLYLNCKAPYGYNADRIISVLLKNIGLEKTSKLIEKNEFPYKHQWLSSLWRIVPEELLDERYTEQFFSFIKEEASMDNPDFPSALCLSKFKAFDYKIVKNVSEIIIDCALKNNYIIAKFFGNFYERGMVQSITTLFEDDWDILERLYLIGFENRFDYKGELLIELVKKNTSFWNDFTKKLAGNTQTSSYEKNVLEAVWALDNYKELIQIAYDNMLENYFSFKTKRGSKVIFSNNINTPADIRQRKKQWIREYIKNNIENKDNIKNIFNIVATNFPAERKEFLRELLKYTSDIAVFKSIPLFSSSSSWSDSEVPLIDKKIDFLTDLINTFKGIEFIEHRAYLKERKISYERYKQDVLIREYLEDGDLA